MRGSRKFCQRQSEFDNVSSVLLVDEGINDPNITINWPSTPFHKRADDCPTFYACLVALYFFRRSGLVLLRDPLFRDFSGWRGSAPPVPPLWIRP